MRAIRSGTAKTKGFLGARELPLRGMSPRDAFLVTLQNLTQELDPQKNLGAFGCEEMDREAEELVRIGMSFDLAHRRSFPKVADIEASCLAMLSEMTNAELPELPTGTACSGASEAAILAGLSLKFRWRAKSSIARPRGHPNIIFSQHATVAWEKFCKFCEVEPRIIAADLHGTSFSLERLGPLVNENTIGVVSTCGDPYTGNFENTEQLNATLDQIAVDTENEIPIHVDGAIGGFPSSFLYPKRTWDFRLPRVHSINLSGHMYGFVSPSLGWLLWRREACCAAELALSVPYLPPPSSSSTLILSRPAGALLAQYYTLVQLGRVGFRKLFERLNEFKKNLMLHIESVPEFQLITDRDSIPMVAWTLRAGAPFTLHDISHEMQRRGWAIPMYNIPVGEQKVSALRVVIRRSYSEVLEQQLITSLMESVDDLRGRTSSRSGLVSPVVSTG